MRVRSSNLKKLSRLSTLYYQVLTVSFSSVIDSTITTNDFAASMMIIRNFSTASSDDSTLETLQRTLDSCLYQVVPRYLVLRYASLITSQLVLLVLHRYFICSKVSYVLETRIYCYHLASLHHLVHYSTVRYVRFSRPLLYYSCLRGYSLIVKKSCSRETYLLSR